MSWWRKKADEEAGDDILDLNDVVWRGIDQQDRLERLADAAHKTAHQTAHQKDAELPEQVSPEQLLPEQLLNEPQSKQFDAAIYPPKQILPTVPLPTGPLTTGSLTTRLQSAASDTQDGAPDPHDPSEPEGLSGVDELIESEIRSQIIAEAMDAVQSFQSGETKSPPTTAKTPENTTENTNSVENSKTNIGSDADLEAAIGQIADQTLAASQGHPPVYHQPDSDLDGSEFDGADRGNHRSPPSTPDMSDAIRHVVADEIGLWLKDHMPRIIHETMAQAALNAPASSKEKQPASSKLKPKTPPKTALKKAKTKSKAATTAQKASAGASKTKTAPKKAKTKTTKSNKPRS